MNSPACVRVVAVLLATAALQSQPADLDPVAEIREIAARPEIRQALAIVQALETGAERELIELTEIPAPPFGEAARAARYAVLLGQAGLDDVAVDGVGNVLARRPGAGEG